MPAKPRPQQPNVFGTLGGPIFNPDGTTANPEALQALQQQLAKQDVADNTPYGVLPKDGKPFKHQLGPDDTTGDAQFNKPLNPVDPEGLDEVPRMDRNDAQQFFDQANPVRPPPPPPPPPRPPARPPRGQSGPRPGTIRVNNTQNNTINPRGTGQSGGGPRPGGGTNTGPGTTRPPSGQGGGGPRPGGTTGPRRGGNSRTSGSESPVSTTTPEGPPPGYGEGATVTTAPGHNEEHYPTSAGAGHGYYGPTNNQGQEGATPFGGLRQNQGAAPTNNNTQTSQGSGGPHPGGTTGGVQSRNPLEGAQQVIQQRQQRQQRAQQGQANIRTAQQQTRNRQASPTTPRPPRVNTRAIRHGSQITKKYIRHG